MSVSDSLSDQVGQASNLVGLLLVLVTLFTSEQARRLAEERSRTGGPNRSTLQLTLWLSIGLALVTIASIAALEPIVSSVLGTIGTNRFGPVFAVFVLVWALLFALGAWQISLVFRSRS
ncbi:MAG: hypothetical protein QOH92_188 [Chloroflexota bacterium]|jgi:hypothetical protein|nr:hypothetical protein [Chloroflexota bacterium]